MLTPASVRVEPEAEADHCPSVAIPFPARRDGPSKLALSPPGCGDGGSSGSATSFFFHTTVEYLNPHCTVVVTREWNLKLGFRIRISGGFVMPLFVFVSRWVGVRAGISPPCYPTRGTLNDARAVSFYFGRRAEILEPQNLGQGVRAEGGIVVCPDDEWKCSASGIGAHNPDCSLGLMKDTFDRSQFVLSGYRPRDSSHRATMSLSAV